MNEMYQGKKETVNGQVYSEPSARAEILYEACLIRLYNCIERTSV